MVQIRNRFTGSVIREIDAAVLRSADLRGADLRGADLRGSLLANVDLRGAVLRGADLTDSDLSGADLRGAVLTRAVLTRARLTWVVGNMRELQTMQCDWWPVAVWVPGGVMQIGCQQHALSDWWAFSDEEIEQMDHNALSWWRKWEPILMQIWPPENKEGNDGNKEDNREN